MTALTQIDRLDRKILDLLQAEGRLTNQILAERVGLSASACLARVRKLERGGVIAGYHARLNPAMLGPGLTLYAEVTLNRHHPQDLARFERALALIDTVVEAAQVSGSFDYLIKAVVPDMGTWTALADELMERDLCVDRISTHVLMKNSKVFKGWPV